MSGCPFVALGCPVVILWFPVTIERIERMGVLFSDFYITIVSADETAGRSPLLRA